MTLELVHIDVAFAPSRHEDVDIPKHEDRDAADFQPKVPSVRCLLAARGHAANRHAHIVVYRDVAHIRQVLQVNRVLAH